MSDAQLITALATDCDGAFAEVCRRHQLAMYKAALPLSGKDGADDIVRDVLERLWLDPRRFDPVRGPLGRFLVRCAQGRAIDVARRDQAEHARGTTSSADDQRQDVERGVVAPLTLDGVAASLRQLPPTERQALALAYLTGHSYREVARLLLRPEGSVKASIRAGLQRLRSVVEMPEGID